MKTPVSSRLRRIFVAWLPISLAALLCPSVSHAYIEYQRFAQTNSGHTVSCAMCHVNGDGPVGMKPGQISSLTSEEQARLTMARGAFTPGQKVDSPILNAFGNHIISTIGKKKFIDLRADPKQLVAALGDESDLDGDGATDAEEFLAGTHPLNPHHGPAMTLFLHNLKQSRLQLLLLILATVAGLYGLNNLLRGFAQQEDEEDQDEETDGGGAQMGSGK